MNSLMLFILFLDFRKSDNKSEIPFAKLYDALPMFRILGRPGRLLMLLFIESFRILAVTKSLPEQDPVRYNFCTLVKIEFLFRNFCCTFDSNDFVGPFSIYTN